MFLSFFFLSFSGHLFDLLTSTSDEGTTRNFHTAVFNLAVNGRSDLRGTSRKAREQQKQDKRLIMRGVDSQVGKWRTSHRVSTNK